MNTPEQYIQLLRKWEIKQTENGWFYVIEKKP